jgi:hypothetical protein
MYKNKTFQYEQHLHGDDKGAARVQFIARWMMIPLTRALDTLVIEIRDPQSVIADVLRAAAGESECKDIVEWRQLQPASSQR